MMDDERKPVSTLAELLTLDERDILHGYYAGLNGCDEPSVEFNRSYWHGWANGMRDKHRMPPTPEAMQLAAEFLADMRKKRAEATK